MTQSASTPDGPGETWERPDGTAGPGRAGGVGGRPGGGGKGPDQGGHWAAAGKLFAGVLLLVDGVLGILKGISGIASVAVVAVAEPALLPAVGLLSVVGVTLESCAAVSRRSARRPSPRRPPRRT